MLRRRAVIVAVGFALAVVPSALGKGGPGEMLPLTICGASGCADLGSNAQPPVRLALVDGSTPALVSVAPAPYYLIGAEVAWVPSESALRLLRDGALAWVATLPTEDTVLREATVDMQPYLPPTRPRVLVDFSIVGRSEGYLRLFTMGTPVTAPVKVAWLPIWFTGGRTPWDDGNVWLYVSRSGSLIQRNGQVFRVAPALAHRIRARLPL